MKHAALFLIITLCFSFSAMAQTPTPTTSPCAALQSCVDAAVPTAIAQCAASNSSCADTKLEKYALSAGQLARRAIDDRNCSAKTAKGACNFCYNGAKLPLRFRLKGDLFKGLLAQAIKLIEAERRVVCLALD